jgi:signal transduction histidine kinase
LLEVFNKRLNEYTQHFTSTDMQRLQSLAEQLGQVLSNYDLIREADARAAAVVHGGRSPLNAINGYADNATMYLDELPKELIKQYDVLQELVTIPRAIKDTVRLASMFINSTLYEARSKYEQGDRDNERPEAVFFLEQVHQLAALWKIKLEHDGKALCVDTESLQDMYFRGAPSQVSLLIGNLMENAVKYSDPNSEIVIAGIEDRDMVGIRIVNTGPRAYEDEEDKENLFRSFYRGRNVAGNSGCGIGLPLCKYIVSRNFGEIAMHCEPGPEAAVDFESGYITEVQFLLPREGRVVGS